MMNFNFIFRVFILMVFIFALPFANASKYDNSISVSQGFFKFVDTSQSLQRIYDQKRNCSGGFLFSHCSYEFFYENADLVLSNQYKKSYALQYEHNFKYNIVVETKFNYVRSKYFLNPTSRTGLSGEGKIDLLKHSVAIKYYLNRHGWLQPYVSYGLGIYHAKLSGPVEESFVNLVRHINLGLSAKISSYRLFLQYSYTDSIEHQRKIVNNDSSGIGQYEGKLDLAGKAVNLGVTWMF